jgi:putative ABC transport system permease protein
MPLAAHVGLPGVHAATPALRYESIGNDTNETDNGTDVNVLGVDPATAPRVMWFRPDFAGQPFKHLLQSIAAPGPGAIVSDSFLSATGLHRGDTFGVALTNNTRVTFRIVSVAHYFPSLDPRVVPFVVANLTYLARASKSLGPNEVWLDTDRNQTTIDRVLALARQWPRQVQDYQGLPPAYASQNDLLTAGIYGVTSIGFLVAALLTLLGFVTYAYLTLQARLIEVAVLRALGMSPGQVRSLLLFEQAFLLGTAILGGIAAGLLTTQLFLPYLPIATNVVPPFLVILPWPAVGAFVLAVLVVFVLILAAHVSLLLRVQLGRVLRLGEG